MNRTDRLFALVEELRGDRRRGRTAQELGDKLEVTARTIKRDISALQQAGVPIYGAPGPGGGYRLVGTDQAVLRPVSFTSSEAVAIAAALRTQPNLPFATDGATALTKVMRAMTPGAVEAAERLAGRVWTTSTPKRSRAARTIDAAIAERRVVSIEYTGREGYGPFGFTGIARGRVRMPGPVDPARLLVAWLDPESPLDLEGLVHGVRPEDPAPGER